MQFQNKLIEIMLANKKHVILIFTALLLVIRCKMAGHRHTSSVEIEEELAQIRRYEDFTTTGL